MNRQTPKQEVEELSLSKAADILVNECRMILPGIQTLFGFQLIAVFQPPFFDKLTSFEQGLHLLAAGLIGMAIVIIMTPPAYHRQTTPREVTQQFIKLSSRLMLLSMAPLALSIGLDFYLISRLILKDALLSLLITVVLLTLFMLLWFVLPRSEALRRAFGDGR